VNFVSYQTLLNDVRSWSDQLSNNIVAVCGIPRSGILPAALLSLHRNCHLITLQQLMNNDMSWRQPLRRGNVKVEGDTILVIDDSVNTGATIRATKAKIQGTRCGYNVEFGTLYVRPDFQRNIQQYYRKILIPRCFEWNLFNSVQMRRSCLDLDGVLCADVVFREEETGEGFRLWLDHVNNAKPRFIPSLPVYAIVTSRLEKYREPTVKWLARHGIQYQELIMSPHSSVEKRRLARDHGKLKAKYFKSQDDAFLFIESSEHQAVEISRLSKKPVLSIETMKLHK